MTERIDPTAWRRKDHYAWFRRLDYPYLAVTAEVDVTALHGACRAQGLSIFAASAHTLVAAANDVPALRQRIVVEDGTDVVLAYPSIDAGLTLAVDDELFTYAAIPFQPDVQRFAADIAAASAAAQGNPALKGLETSHDRLFFLSCLPWIRFTQVVHPVPIGRANPPDSVPRISWGRFTRVGDTMMCPVNIQAHHALVDGKHLARFFDALQTRLHRWAAAPPGMTEA